MRVATAFLIAVLGLLACGDANAPGANAVLLPPSLQCSGEMLPGSTPRLKKPPERDTSKTAPPEVGQMTQDAAKAKRLFDGEHWQDAEIALARVMRGDTGDDLGNRQLAEYHHAIAIFRQHRDADAADAFAEIAVMPSHLKHLETLLWIGKLAPGNPALVRTLVAFKDSEIELFNNANQRELYWQLAYLFGRERVEREDREHARVLFQKVDHDSAYRRYATDCLVRIGPAIAR